MKRIFKKIYRSSFDEFISLMINDLTENKKRFIVTANPETFITAEKNLDFEVMLLDNNTTIVPDGIGTVKAARMLGYEVQERITGIDLSKKLLEYGNLLNKDIYLFGSTEEVITKLKVILKSDYPNLNLVGSSNGYIEHKDELFDSIAALRPDIVLVALGIPLQERLIYKHLNKFDKGIFVGVGGSFDTISGNVARAPKIFIKMNIEWLYRLIREPKRIKRFYKNNIKFIFKLKKYK